MTHPRAAVALLALVLPAAAASSLRQPPHGFAAIRGLVCGPRPRAFQSRETFAAAQPVQVGGYVEGHPLAGWVDADLPGVVDFAAWHTYVEESSSQTHAGPLRFRVVTLAPGCVHLRLVYQW